MYSQNCVYEWIKCFLNVETYQNMTKSKPNVADIVKRTANRNDFVRISKMIQIENLQAQYNQTKQKWQNYTMKFA